ncbi:hypothetical protein [Marispirochaeta aestuarii]|uniref:hypothetical protein n=1 Tax=Marispirochaeta aestuarii TaxID=1963862 RepID=UPI0011775EC3|nr:hypothetical protein [Marispirochaeta aestuarii]
MKTSKNGKNFVTSYFPKYKNESADDPDYWVFFKPRLLTGKDNDEFYVFSHSQVREIQLIVNNGTITEKGKGVDNISIKLLKEYSDALNNFNRIFIDN